MFTYTYPHITIARHTSVRVDITMDKTKAMDPVVAKKPQQKVSRVTPIRQDPQRVSEIEVKVSGRALYNFVAQEDRELSLKEGDSVQIIYDYDDWLFVLCNGRKGYVPNTYISREKDDDEAVYENHEIPSGSETRGQKDDESKRNSNGYVEIINSAETLKKVSRFKQKLPATNEPLPEVFRSQGPQIKAPRPPQAVPLPGMNVPKAQQRFVYPTIQISSMVDLIQISGSLALLEISKYNGTIENGTGICLPGNLLLTRFSLLLELIDKSASLQGKEKNQFFKSSTKVIFGHQGSIPSKTYLKPQPIFTMIEEDLVIMELKGKVVSSTMKLIGPKSTENDWTCSYPIVMGFTSQRGVACQFCSVERSVEDGSKYLTMESSRMSHNVFGSPCLFVRGGHVEIIAVVTGRKKTETTDNSTIAGGYYQCLKVDNILQQLKLYNPALLTNIS